MKRERIDVTCDMCGAAIDPNGKLDRGDISLIFTGFGRGHECDVCGTCAAKPLREIFARLSGGKYLTSFLSSAPK